MTSVLIPLEKLLKGNGCTENSHVLYDTWTTRINKKNELSAMLHSEKAKLGIRLSIPKLVDMKYGSGTNEHETEIIQIQICT